MRKILCTILILSFATLFTGCTDLGVCLVDPAYDCVYVNGTEDTIELYGVDTNGQERFRVSLAPNEESDMIPWLFASNTPIDNVTYSNGTVEWTLKKEKAERDIRPYRDLFDKHSYAEYVYYSSYDRCWSIHTYIYKFVDEDFTETKPKN